MNIALFYYDGFSEFEVVLVGLFFKQYDIMSIALENREYCSEERQRFCVDRVIQEVDADAIDLLIIPGGDPAPLVENQELKSFIKDLLQQNKKVAGICGGSILLAGLGLLKGKRCTGMSSGVDPRLRSYYDYYAESTVVDAHVVVDGNSITAQGQAYVEFAAELLRQMGLLKREDEYDEVVRWFKNIRSTDSTHLR